MKRNNDETKERGLRWVSYGEALRDFERTWDETRLDLVNFDASQNEVFVEAWVIAGSDGRNRLDSWYGFWFLFAQPPLQDLPRLLHFSVCLFHRCYFDFEFDLGPIRLAYLILLSTLSKFQVAEAPPRILSRVDF